MSTWDGAVLRSSGKVHDQWSLGLLAVHPCERKMFKKIPPCVYIIYIYIYVYCFIDLSTYLSILFTFTFIYIYIYSYVRQDLHVCLCLYLYLCSMIWYLISIIKTT